MLIELHFWWQKVLFFVGSVGAHQTQSGEGIRVNSPTRKKILLIVIFCHFANGKFAKFKFS